MGEQVLHPDCSCRAAVAMALADEAAGGNALSLSADPSAYSQARGRLPTALLDPVAYPAASILALYGDRCTVQLPLRDIKITLRMDRLRGKSPSMVRKEIYMHLLAYNRIRHLMVCAAADHGRDLHRLSFAGAVQHVDAMLPYLQIFAGTSRACPLVALLLRWIAHDTVPDRPGRVEPRVVKRRPKQYGHLNRPRRQMRKELLAS